MASRVSPAERKAADQKQKIIKENTQLLTGAQEDEAFNDDEPEQGEGSQAVEGKVESGVGKKEKEKWTPGSSKLSNLLKGTKFTKDLAVFKSANRQLPETQLTKYFTEAKKSLNFAGEKQAGAGYFAQQYMRENEKRDKKAAFETYMDKIKSSLKDQNDKGWEKLGGEWDKANLIWSIKGNKMLERKVNYLAKNRNAKALGEFNTQILQQQLTKQKMKNYVPAMVYELMKSNLTLSKYGIGRVSAQSLPFYAGRYLDPFTGRIKTMQMMSQKYLNPTSYKQHLFYLQSKIIAKWNSFVRAQEEYLRLTTKDPKAYTQLKQNTIKKNMNKNDNVQTAFANLYKQIQIWRAGLPSAQNISLVCEKCLQKLGADGMNKFIEIIQDIGIKSKQLMWSNNQVEGERIKYIQELNKVYKAIPAPNKETASVDEIKLYAKITGAFSLWANKGLASTQRAVKKYIRTFIPDDLPVDKIAKISTQLKNADQKINSIFGRLKKDGDDFVGMKNFKAGSTADEFISTLEMFDPKGERSLTIVPLARTSKSGQAVKVYPQKFALKF